MKMCNADNNILLIDATPTATWSLVEPSFEIFCACLPAMTPLLKAGRWLVKVTSNLSYGSRKGASKFNSSERSAGLPVTPPGGAYNSSFGSKAYPKASVTSDDSGSANAYSTV